ncbi:MAG: hypothetical protein CMD88_04700 [Gammaproteobacteria bacterium]|nr:hypothetical protein [Gammaproteobacteria bacterium]|tara:strand:- start:662 stop:952 length:291 start_codon:yes stop_codon:yes gene_type:complete
MVKEELQISILDQEYKIKCNKDETDLLKESINYLNNQIDETKSSKSNFTNDKILVLTSLKIVSQFLKQKNELKDLEIVSDEIAKLQDYIDVTGDGS